jgi:uncharacterized protein (TIRG00374 family)
MVRTRRVVAGFALALVLVAALLWAVGPASIGAELAGTDLPVFALGFLGITAALACWSEAVRRLLASAGSPVGGSRYRRAYLAGEFLKQVVPLGQSAGPVLLSYAVSTATDASRDHSLAAATVFAFCNVTASLVLAVVGLTVLIATRRGPTGPLLRSVLVVTAVVSLAIAIAAVLAVFRRSVLERGVYALTDTLRRTVGRLSVRVREALARERVTATLAAFETTVVRVSRDRSVLLTVGGLSVAGWLCFLVPLYTSFRALGSPVPFTLVVFVVPVVTLLNVVPLPGGLGGFEAALAGVTAALSTADLATATAAVVLFRLTNYWFLVALGGLAAGSLSLGVADAPDVSAVEDHLPVDAATRPPDGERTDSGVDGRA